MYDSEQFFQETGISRETLLTLREFVSLLLHWQKSFNLIGSSTEKEIWQRHILDSAQLKQFLHNPGCLIDLGSGGGLPGVVLAIMGHSNVKLIESNKKKCLFLREVSRSLGLNIETINVRIEDYKQTNQANYITSRALAPLDQLLRYSEPLLAPGGKCFFLKGIKFEAELTKAKKNWRMKLQKHASLSSAEGVVVEIAGLNSINESPKHYRL